MVGVPETNAGRAGGPVQLGSVVVRAVGGGAGELLIDGGDLGEHRGLALFVGVEGDTSLLLDRRWLRLPAGGVALWPRRDVLRFRSDAGWRGILAGLSRDLVPVADRVLRALCGRVGSSADGDAAVLKVVLESALAHGPSLSSAAADRLGRVVVDLATASLGAHELATSNSDALRLQVLSFIRSHLAEPDLSHDTIAQAHNVSARTLHRLFAHDMTSPSQLIKKLRLDAIRDEISAGSEPIAYIAARWGFHDLPNFNRAFRAAFGENPSSVREQTG